LTGIMAAGALLIVVGVVCALLYAGWLHRSRRGASAAAMLTDTAATERAASRIVGPEPIAASGLPRALTLAWVEGTYVSTTVAISRHERVAVAGLGERARAAMVVDDSAVRWEREGIGDVRVAGPKLVGVSLERGMASRLLGQAHLVLVSWNADSGKNGDRYITGFLPRNRMDSAVLASAVQRLMKIGASIDDASTTSDGTP